MRRRPRFKSCEIIWNILQELFCVESESEATEALSVLISQELGPHTPFGTLVAAQANMEKKPKKLKQNIGYGIAGHSAVSQVCKLCFFFWKLFLLYMNYKSFSKYSVFWHFLHSSMNVWRILFGYVIIIRKWY